MNKVKIELNIDKKEKKSDFNLKISNEKEKKEIVSNILELYDWGEFELNLLDAAIFYLNHGFGEFEIVDKDYRHHIILSLNDILIFSQSFQHERNSTIKFENFDCWYFIKELIISLEKNKEEWNTYLKMCVHNDKERGKMLKKIEKKIKKIKKELSIFPKYEIV